MHLWFEFLPYSLLDPWTLLFYTLSERLDCKQGFSVCSTNHDRSLLYGFSGLFNYLHNLEYDLDVILIWQLRVYHIRCAVSKIVRAPVIVRTVINLPCGIEGVCAIWMLVNTLTLLKVWTCLQVSRQWAHLSCQTEMLAMKWWSD